MEDFETAVVFGETIISRGHLIEDFVQHKTLERRVLHWLKVNYPEAYFAALEHFEDELPTDNEV